MQPVLDKGFFAGKTFRLGDFVLMVGKNDILAAAVNIYLSRRGISWTSPSIRCASRACLCPRGCPRTARRAWLLSRGRSPWGVLSARQLQRAPRPSSAPGTPGKLAVVRNLTDTEKNVAADRVGEAFINESFGCFDDFRDSLGGEGGEVGLKDIKRGHVLEIALGIFGGQLFDGDTEAVGMVNDVVLDIGDVFHVLDLIAAEFQVTADDIEDNIAHGMADV